jgi:hypothetical protein
LTGYFRQDFCEICRDLENILSISRIVLARSSHYRTSPNFVMTCEQSISIQPTLLMAIGWDTRALAFVLSPTILPIIQVPLLMNIFSLSASSRYALYELLFIPGFRPIILLHSHHLPNTVCFCQVCFCQDLGESGHSTTGYSTTGYSEGFGDSCGDGGLGVTVGAVFKWRCKSGTNSRFFKMQLHFANGAEWNVLGAVIARD